MSTFSLVSTIISIACFVWVAFLVLFVIVKSIIRKIKFKKEQNTLIKEHEKKKGRFYGFFKRKKKDK